MLQPGQLTQGYLPATKQFETHPPWGDRSFHIHIVLWKWPNLHTTLYSVQPSCRPSPRRIEPASLGKPVLISPVFRVLHAQFRRRGSYGVPDRGTVPSTHQTILRRRTTDRPRPSCRSLATTNPAFDHVEPTAASLKRQRCSRCIFLRYSSQRRTWPCVSLPPRRERDQRSRNRPTRPGPGVRGHASVAQSVPRLDTRPVGRIHEQPLPSPRTSVPAA